MSETGIDWNYYDHGPGSEEHKRKMAAEQREYDKNAWAERRDTHIQAERVPGLEAEIKRLQAIIAKFVPVEFAKEQNK